MRVIKKKKKKKKKKKQRIMIPLYLIQLHNNDKTGGERGGGESQ